MDMVHVSFNWRERNVIDHLQALGYDVMVQTASDIVANAQADEMMVALHSDTNDANLLLRKVRMLSAAAYLVPQIMLESDDGWLCVFPNLRGTLQRVH